jgi:alkylation response protein AidB-like acyl-CoA dehydrogenase
LKCLGSRSADGREKRWVDATVTGNVERYYRDAPVLTIGGGTNELQRLIIAKGLVAKYRVK